MHTPHRRNKRRNIGISKPTALSPAQPKSESEHWHPGPSASLLSLPIEIFVEILSYCTSRELLALTRSNKGLCHVFVAPDNAWIWKRLRSKDPNRPPDPPARLPEPAYATLLYDPSVCEVR